MAAPSSKPPSEAIRLSNAHPGEIHIVLTDVIMAEMNGRDLSEKLMAKLPMQVFAIGLWPKSRGSTSTE